MRNNVNKFKVIKDYVEKPEVIYDGLETLEVQIEEDEYQFKLDLNNIVVKYWNKYFSDTELSDLKKLLKLDCKFILGKPYLINQKIDQKIYFQIFYKCNYEYTICFAYDEVSAGHYTFWLIAVLNRKITKEEYEKRINGLKD